MAECLARETQNLYTAVGGRSNPIPGRIFFFTNSRLIFTLLHFLELLFVVFSLVFAKRVFASVFNYSNLILVDNHLMALFPPSRKKFQLFF